MLFPPVRSFRVPGTGLRLVDYRDLDREDASTATRLVGQVLSELLARIRPDTRLCETEIYRDALGRPASHNTGHDPSLPMLDLAVFQGPHLLGGLSLYDMRVSTTPEGVAVRAKPLPGFAKRGVRVTESWGRVLRHILEEPMQLRDGRLVDVQSWEFPEVDGHDWHSQGHEDDDGDAIVAEMIGGRHQVDVRADGRLLAVRRRLAQSAD